jgi:hypothetical protein
MLFNPLLDMPHLSGGWITWTKEKCSPTAMYTNVCTKCERNTLLVCMGHSWDLLLQLRKHGTNTSHVAFIFLFSVDAFMAHFTWALSKTNEGANLKRGGVIYRQKNDGHNLKIRK